MEKSTSSLPASSLPVHMATDPKMMEKMAWLQSQVGNAINEMIDEVAKSLPEDMNNVGKGGSVKELAAASRHAARSAQERRELAEALVIGALLNRDNPDWDPQNPETHRPNYQDPLVQLMQMNIAGEG